MIKTVITTAGVNTVTFPEFYKYFWIKNTGDTTVYASAYSNVSAGVDNTSALNSGDIVRIENVDNPDVYIYGDGALEIHAIDDNICPFKLVKKGGEGSGKAEYISDGLIKSIVLTENDISECNITLNNISDVIVSDEMTVECCCIYSGFGSTENKGRIFTSINNDVLIAMSMYNNTLEAAMNTDIYYGWATDGVTGITVDPNEFVTLAMTSDINGTKFYKNSVECGNYGGNVVSKSGSVIDKICVKYEENRSNRNLTGNVYMLRFYDRILSAVELYANAKADIQNFTR